MFELYMDKLVFIGGGKVSDTSIIRAVLTSMCCVGVHYFLLKFIS